MPIWKEPAGARSDTPASATAAASKPAAAAPAKTESPIHGESTSTYDLPRRVADRDAKESLIAGDLTVEGKIDGAGHVRIAGRFKGDINVQGHLTIEVGAKVNGAVRANTVVIGGELEGNIESAARVELLESGVLQGDVKAGTLTVAAGSRMRGNAEFGWEERAVGKPNVRMESGSAA